MVDENMNDILVPRESNGERSLKIGFPIMQG